MRIKIKTYPLIAIENKSTEANRSTDNVLR